MRREACALIGPTACGFDREQPPRPLEDVRDGPDTEGVERMGLWNPKSCPIPFRSPTGAGHHRHADGLDGSRKRPPDTVDGRGVSEGSLGLCVEMRKPVFVCGLIPLVEMAWPTGQRQIRVAVGSFTTPRHDVFDLRRNVRFLARDALSSPLFEEIVSEFVTEQRALLVLDSGDLRILQGLRVELHELHHDSGDGHPALEPSDPGRRRVDTVLQTGWEPAFWPGSIVKPRWPVPEIRRSSPTSIATALCQFLANLGAAMLEFA